MDPGKTSSQSPGRGIFDAANLIGSPFPTPTSSSSSAAPFAHLPHLPASAFSMFGRHPGFPPFGGLGTFAPPLGLNPTTGGADWWRAASEHARRMAGVDFYGLGSPLSPTFGSFGGVTPTSDTGFGVFSGPLFQPFPTTTASSTSSLTSPKSHRSTSSPPISHAAVTVATTSPTPTLTTSAKSPPASSSSRGRKRSSGTPTSVITAVPKPALTPPKLNAEDVKKKMKLPADDMKPLNLCKTDSSRSRNNSADDHKYTEKREDLPRHRSSSDAASKKTSSSKTLTDMTQKKLIAEKLQRKLQKQQSSEDLKASNRKNSGSSSSSSHSITTNILTGKFKSPEGRTTPDPLLPNGEKLKDTPSLSLWSSKLFSPSESVPVPSVVEAGNKQILSFASLAASGKQTTAKESESNETETAVSKPKQLSGGMTSEKMGLLFPGLMGLKSPKSTSTKQPTSETGVTSPTLSMGKVMNSATIDKDTNKQMVSLVTGTKTSVKTTTTDAGKPRGRGRGRPAKLPKRASPKVGEIDEEKRKKEMLKMKFEAELKQQQLQLKLQRKAKAMKEKEAILKAQQTTQKLESQEQHKLEQETQKLQHEHQKLLQQQRELQNKDGQKKQRKEKLKVKPQQSKLAQVLLGQDQPSTSKIKDDDKEETSKKNKDEEEKESSDDDEDEEDDSDSGSSSSDSGSESDDDDQSTQESTSEATPKSGRKRSGTDTATSTPTPIKRKRVTDESILKLPLEKGWKRQTFVRTLGPRGILGEVLYLGPCGKKFKAYPDVLRYLSKNNITDLARENFTYSTKFKLGEFFQVGRLVGEHTPMSEEDVTNLYTAVQARKTKHQVRMQKYRAKKAQLQREQEEKERKKRERQGKMLKKLNEIKMKKQMEKQSAVESAKRIKQLKVFELKRQKEQLKIMKRQEKIQRQEALRMEREMRAQQVIEARRRRKAEIQSQRFMEAMKKAKERERRRQHMLLVKALEARKKQEERERAKEEKRAEKRMFKERKLEQKRLEVQMAKELKKPVDDMQLRDLKPLPTLNRIPGVKLAGQAFADCLMVLEFIHNFTDALDLDAKSLPSLNTLQMGLLNLDEDAVEDMVALVVNLLKEAIDDPGVPHPKEAMTILGEKLTDLDINENNVSEALRLFIGARNGRQDKMALLLKEKPFTALNPTNKAAIMAFLCNELLCSKNIVNEIEGSIETVSNLRRDKWVVEGKIRKLKSLQSKKFKTPTPVRDKSESLLGENEDTNLSSVAPSGNNSRGSDDEDESGNESGEDHGEGNVSDEEEEDGITAEELEKKLEKFTKQQSQFRNKVFESSHKLRAMSFGQDRYHRQYWVLPYAGGIFVEGVESAEVSEYKNEDSEKENDKTKLKNENDVKGEQDNFKKENCDDSQNVKKGFSEEKVKNEETVEEKNINIKTEQMNGHLEEIEEKNVDKLNCSSSSTNLFLQEPSVTKFSDLVQKDDISSKAMPIDMSMNSSLNNSSFLFNSSISSANSSANKSGYISIDSILKNDTSKSPSLFHSKLFSDSANNSGEVPTSHMKNGTYLDYDSKPWFGILPRMPCDESTITRSPNSSVQIKTDSNNQTPASVPFLSPGAYGPFGTKLNNTPAFASFQMGNIRPHTPVGFGVSGISPLNSAFKNELGATSTPNSAHNMPGTMNDLETLQHKEPQPIPKELQHGWWRITDPIQVKSLLKCLHLRGIRERNLQKCLQKYQDYACQACTKGSKEATDLQITDLDREISQNSIGAPDPDKANAWSPDVSMEIEMSILEDIEAMEERIFNASLQVKGWKLPTKATDDEEIELVSQAVTERKEHQHYTIDLARQRLKNLERNIERRYLKPPFTRGPEVNLNRAKQHNPNDSGSDSEDEDLTPALLSWRKAVDITANPAQLLMCMLQLNNAIAWEKSIMKVLCQICRLDDNEAELLLCDSCDRGYHTYCFKPKLENIPEGDWYCFECISKAAGTAHCLVCGKSRGKMVECDSCPKAYHIDCMNPPLPRVPRKWTCISCLTDKTRPKGKRGRKSKQEKELEMLTEAAQKEGSKRGKGDNSRDFSICSILLKEMEEHEEGWPFLKPVSSKQFPQYRKFIKQPMDFQTMQQKLDDGVYKSCEEFSADARLVFDNCKTFNEDDSEVGEAGHIMRKFFNKRWQELMNS